MTFKYPLVVLAPIIGYGIGTANAQEDWTEQLSAMVKQGEVSLDLRYRYENVDQDSAQFNGDAEAALLRSRLTFQSAELNGFSFLLEADDVRNIGPNDYNSTENGETRYPVIADPEYTELNQAWLRYVTDGAEGTLGRQRILHDNQRFIGGVGWRQNEQTYDGLRVVWNPIENFKVDVSYVYNVNRIFGPDDGANPADLEGDNVFLLANYSIDENHRVSGFGYYLDFDEDQPYAAGKTVNNSTQTFGVEYTGNYNWLNVVAAYATQSEAGDSELEYDAGYYRLELGAKIEGLSARVGYEVLESDEDDDTGTGVGFKTPLATLHKFQGWADKFLATPGDGIEDAWVSIGGKAGPVKLLAVYHDFQAEDSSDDFGTELDLVATWPVNKQLTVQAKYAQFNTDNNARYDDTDKLWLTLQLKL